MTKVKFTEPAEYDLHKIEQYIWVELNNPQSAIHIVRVLYSKADWQNILRN